MRDYPKLLRVWHWLFAFITLGMVGTVILRKTFLSWRSNSELIVSKLSDYGIDVSVEQAKVIAKAIRAPMWEWHIILGYLFALLIVWRVIMIVRDGFNYNDSDTHMKMVHIGYKVLYLLVIIMAVSGIVLNNHELLSLSKDFKHTIKEMHELLAWGIMLFVPLHIVGVVISEFNREKNIISKMISG